MEQLDPCGEEQIDTAGEASKMVSKQPKVIASTRTEALAAVTAAIALPEMASLSSVPNFTECFLSGAR